MVSHNLVAVAGLNVSLGTDDPLQFQSTKDPLLEEYTVRKDLLCKDQGAGPFSADFR